MLYEEFYEWVRNIVFNHEEGEYREYIGYDGSSCWRNVGGYRFGLYWGRSFDVRSVTIGKLCKPGAGDWCIDEVELWTGDDASVYGGEGFGPMTIPF
jgi:hypothetical protein